jgi:hypothetical protein
MPDFSATFFDYDSVGVHERANELEFLANRPQSDWAKILDVCETGQPRGDDRAQRPTARRQAGRDSARDARAAREGRDLSGMIEQLEQGDWGCLAAAEAEPVGA